MLYRFATPEDAAALALLNQQLIRDEGHRNPMSVLQLEARMHDWLEAEYRAVLVEADEGVIAYALFRRESAYVYLRQLFVAAAVRRRGVGKALIAWLRRNAWEADVPVRLDVLVGNTAGQGFWRSVGFADYCVTMELPAQDVR